MKSDFSKLEKYFDASDEKLIRSTDEGVDEMHLSHYENRLGKYLKDPNVKKILDLGCGEGKILKKFASRYPDNISTILRAKGALVHMSIPDDVHCFRALTPEKLNLLIILKIFLKMLLTFNNSKHRKYGTNGFWWSKSLMIDIHKSKYRKTKCQSSDSWYRFDFIAEK